jgi:hypothetical protein
MATSNLPVARIPINPAKDNQLALDAISSFVKIRVIKGIIKKGII